VAEAEVDSAEPDSADSELDNEPERVPEAEPDRDFDTAASRPHAEASGPYVIPVPVLVLVLVRVMSSSPDMMSVSSLPRHLLH
jgi:hypothetical protein